MKKMANQKKVSIDKVIKKKVISCMSSGKVMTIHLVVEKWKIWKRYHYIKWVISQKQVIMAEKKIELDLSNYAIKFDLKK